MELAQQAGLTLIGRARGSRFIALSGTQRIIFDHTDNAEDADNLSEKASAQRAFYDQTR